MINITDNFGTLYHPKSALLFYASGERGNETYVERYDINSNGMPINAHPLTVREAGVLAKMLKITDEKKQAPVLKPKSIIDKSILFLDAVECKAMWHTKVMERDLYFAESLGILNGKANVPPMLWIADRNKLSVFALASNRRPKLSTKLYHAPFFNVHKDGSVCMGTVNVRLKHTTSLEEFTSAWENYFFNSYFSHLFENFNPVNGNCVLLWESLIGNGKAFPMKILKEKNRTLKDFMP